MRIRASLRGGAAPSAARSRARARRTSHLLLLAFVAAAAAAAVPGAEAPRRHTELLATYPAADTVHGAEIREIRLRYSTAVQAPLSTITVEGPGGRLPNLSPLDTVPGSGGQEIRVTLADPLPSGAYTVEWRTAGPDSHPLAGAFTFTVERPVEATPPPTGEVAAGDPLPGDPVLTPTSGAVQGGSDPRDPAGLFVRGLFLLSIVGMLGTAVFRLSILSPMVRDPLFAPVALQAGARVRALAWAVAGAAALALPIRLGKQSAELFGDAAFAPASLGRLLGSGWGGAWILELSMAALFVAGLLLVRGGEDRTRGWWAMLVAGLGMAMVPALSGHAAGTPEPVRAFAILNDAVHVTAAGVWMGTLAVLVLAGIGATVKRAAVVPVPVGAGWSDEEGGAIDEGADDAGPHSATQTSGLLPPLARMVNGFSRIALVAVAVLLATGLVSAWLHLGSVGALFASGYGRTLMVKLALVAGAASLGFYNWRVVRPELAREPRAALIRIPATIEVALGVAVVMVTAVLISTSPPMR
jgi:copper transport protein